MHPRTQLHRFRGFLRFASDATLVDALSAPCLPRLRTRLLAESIQRAWLFGRGGVPLARDAGFSSAWESCGIPPATVSDLEHWIAGQAAERDWRPPRSWLEWAAPALRDELVRLLEIWRLADGFVPLVIRGDDPRYAPAVALPFRLLPGRGAGSRSVLGARGVDCGIDFAVGMEAAECIAKKFGWLPARSSLGIEMSSLDGPSGTWVSGTSAGFPVLLARVFRHSGIRVPATMLGASGSLDAASLGMAVAPGAEILRIKETLIRNLGVEEMALPGLGDREWSRGEAFKGQVEQFVDRMRDRPGVESDRREEYLRIVAKRAEEMHSGFGDADKTERAMSKLLADDLPRDCPLLHEARGRALLTLAAARSHLGKTGPADEAVREALDVLSDLPAALRGDALVRHAVILQDMGDYEAAKDACGQALELAAGLGDSLDRMEMEMKALGTRGQVFACHGLEETAGEAAKLGWEDLSVARDLAREIDRTLGRRDSFEEPRNAVYLYWWRAMHAPESADDFWQEASAQAKRDHGETSYDFLLRHRWLAVYRSVIVNGQIPAWWDGRDADILPRDGSWLEGTSLKYRGTWRAALGEVSETIEDFETAMRILTAKPTPLFTFFALTSALQACESLRSTSPERSGAFLNQAFGFLEKLGRADNLFPARSFRGSAWSERMEALIDGGTPSCDPQRGFPY